MRCLLTKLILYKPLLVSSECRSDKCIQMLMIQSPFYSSSINSTSSSPLVTGEQARQVVKKKSEFAEEKWFDYTKGRPKHWAESDRWRLKLPKSGSKEVLERVGEVKAILQRSDDKLNPEKKVSKLYHTIDKEAFQEPTEEELNTLLPKYNNSEELKDAPDLLKRTCTLRYGSRRDIVQYRVDEALQKYQIYGGDTMSHEAMVARMTIEIRNLQLHCRTYFRDRRSKRALSSMIQKRDSKLRQVKEWNAEQYGNLLRGLKLEITDSPEDGCERQRHLFARHFAIRRYLELKLGKLEELKIRLKSQQAAFRAEKERILAEIATEEGELGITHEDKEKVLRPVRLTYGKFGMRVPPLKVKAQ